jgi:hypothetical protein
MTAAPAGRFVWHEIQTPDPQAAVAYYAALFDWKTKEIEMGPGGAYTEFLVGDLPMAGMDPQKSGQASWASYATVEDVDAAMARAEKLGGKMLEAPRDIPGVGRYAVLQDPLGAVIRPFKFADAEPPEMPNNHHGWFCWDEMHTTDVEKSKGFYGEVFGWSFQGMEMGPMGTYWMAGRGELPAAGFMPAPPEATPQWLPAVFVDDVDARTKKAMALGGKVWVEPSDIPGMGRFSVTSDPQGAMLTLFRAS